MSQPPEAPRQANPNNVVHIDRLIIDRLEYEREILQRQAPQLRFGTTVEEEYVQRTQYNLARLRQVVEGFVTIDVVYSDDKPLDNPRPDRPTPPDFPPSQQGM